ncbi:MAG: hypothetical protein M3Y28_11435, partial [Armatimonadota bacterium]|nr:hypothetical protein [Armatimonadota bacterium]
LCLLFKNTWGDVPTTLFSLAVLLLVPLAITAIFAALRPPLRRPFGYFCLAGSVTAAVLAVLFGLLFWLVSHTYAFGTGILLSTGLFRDGHVDNPRLLNGDTLPIVIGVLSSVALPLLLCLVFSIAARVKRVPVSAGVVQGFRLGTPLVLCLLAIGYGGLTLWTVRQENAVNVAFAQFLHGEEQYTAQITGQAWPGAGQ